MLSLQALLSSLTERPAGRRGGEQYMDNLAEFNAQARRWTREHAGAGAKDEKPAAREMGFAENAARAALGRAAGMNSRRRAAPLRRLKRTRVTTTRGAEAAVRERRAGRTRRRGTPFFL